MDSNEPTKILVVDDEPDLELLISQKFRKKIRNNDFSFTFAHNGIDALDKLKDNEIDIVLTDLNMPEMDGLTLISKLKEQYPNTRSVIISAYGDMDNIRKALNHGAFDFLTKPIDFEDLEITISKTLNEVIALKQAELDREKLIVIERELNVAYQIQSSMVPREFPAFPDRDEFEIYAQMYPAKNVGGDFYDFFLIDKYHLYFIIGDVSGKGIPAALFMAMSKTLIKAIALKGMPPEICLDEVNKILNMENDSSMFVTVFAGVLNTFTGEVKYCNSGHNHPYLLSKDGDVRMLEKTNGVALGIMDDDNLYSSKSIMLQPGDSIFLYTDGVTEATDCENFLFSDERLHELLKSMTGSSPTEIVNRVVSEVNTYSADVMQADDITAMCFKYIK